LIPAQFANQTKEFEMSASKKFSKGLIAGFVAVAFAGTGLAIAQAVPPDPTEGNHAIGAGQQSSFVTPMGETGVLAEQPMAPAVVVIPAPAEPVAVAPEPAPAEPVAVAPEPAPAPVAEAPVEQPPQLVARADRN
jgi:hypothetical protein